MKVLIIGFSKTGNTYSFMDYIKDYIQFDYDLIKCKYKDTPNVDVSKYDLIVIGSSTWGDGVIPKNAKKFVIDNATKYKKDWIVFGTGNTIFVHYCKAVDNICKILNDTGNNVVNIFKYEQQFVYDNLEDSQKEKLEEIKKDLKNY